MEKGRHSRIRTSADDRTDMRPRDWALLIVGLAVVAGLVAFVLLRSNRAVTDAPIAEVTQSPPAAAQPTDDHDHEAEAQVRRMSAAELQSAIDRGQAMAMDVRDIDSYAAGHIPGALHIPLAMVESQVAYLPRDKTIVAYCT